MLLRRQRAPMIERGAERACMDKSMQAAGGLQNVTQMQQYTVYTPVVGTHSAIRFISQCRSGCVAEINDIGI